MAPINLYYSIKSRLGRKKELDVSMGAYGVAEVYELIGVFAEFLRTAVQ